MLNIRLYVECRIDRFLSWYQRRSTKIRLMIVMQVMQDVSGQKLIVKKQELGY